MAHDGEHKTRRTAIIALSVICMVLIILLFVGTLYGMRLAAHIDGLDARIILLSEERDQLEEQVSRFEEEIKETRLIASVETFVRDYLDAVRRGDMHTLARTFWSSKARSEVATALNETIDQRIDADALMTTEGASIAQKWLPLPAVQTTSRVLGAERIDLGRYDVIVEFTPDLYSTYVVTVTVGFDPHGRWYADTWNLTQAPSCR